MPVDKNAYFEILKNTKQKNALLVAVSKTKPVAELKELYELGQRDFGENYVQELLEKQQQLPEDTRWHFIGHLQSNKVKNIVPFVHLIHGVDSLKLLLEINRQAGKVNRKINILLQVYIAKEETKFGLDELELTEVLNYLKVQSLENVNVAGLMGMSSFTDNKQLVKQEFHYLKSIFDRYPQFEILSMGMSGDYMLALEEGSNMVRVGSLIFGSRS